MLTINSLAMTYGSKLLFTDVNLNLNKGNKYSVVGANGTGKTTFLKLLTGEEEPSYGEVIIPKKLGVGCLKQDQFRYENTPIINVVIAGKKNLWQAICEKEDLLAQEILDDVSASKLGELEQIIADNDGYIAEYIAGELLTGLGIREEFHHQNLSVLSGGYKLRVLLAQSLFDNPDILLLDEPTNHLDINSICWLENYLKYSFKGVLVFISHDIAFVNNLATHILDIDYGEIGEYVGNYNKFIEQKQAITEQKLHKLRYTERKVAKMKEFIEKFRASNSRAKQSKSREKSLEKIELPDIQKSSRISPNFNFRQKRPSGKVVLKVSNLTKNYDNKNILIKVNFTIYRGEKVVIIGPNGVGKSTLLKILMGKASLDCGNYEWGYETHISYIAQDHHELLNSNITVFDWLQTQINAASIGVIRNILGQVLFKQEEVYKNVLTLSGGESARLLLAKTMLEENNILILDEPTNHLDIEAKEALKMALINYPGTLLMVTHDRDFTNNIATRVISLDHGKVN